jgi:hypothetical protein
MEDAVNHHPLVFHLVHEAIRANHQISETRVRRIRVWSPALAELLKRISGVADSLGQGGCEGG